MHRIADSYEKPITENEMLNDTKLLWRVHYKTDVGVSYVYTYCKTQKESENLFINDVKNWDGDTSSYKFLYAEIIGELIH